MVNSAFSEEPIASLDGARGDADKIKPALLRSVSTKFSKAEVRTSLRASTLDGVFATLFTTITGGVLLNNFLVELQATPFQIGMLASIPMLANLLQPLGAFWADRTTSRRRYGLWVYGVSRMLWLPLAIAILLFSHQPDQSQTLIWTTLVLMLATHLLGALGSASWLSWLAVLVPRQLRGRYFGFRNSAFSLTSLIALPLLGLMVSHWIGGTVQGYGVLLALGVAAGMISLSFQNQMTDVNPQLSSPVLYAAIPEAAQPETAQPETAQPEASSTTVQAAIELDRAIGLSLEESGNTYSGIFHSVHALLFLVYFGLWAFGVNVSNPFFNLYLLDNLGLDVSWVTLYNALAAGANLLMLLVWGKLADRVGNRPILLLDGLVVAVVPLFWLGTDTTPISIWLWFPLLHLLGGGTGAAIDLCLNNLQLAVAPLQQATKYFAITAAVGGVAGAMGALVGGWLAQSGDAGGMTGLFALSAVLRLVALLPLVWLQEPQRQSLSELLQHLVQQVQTWLLEVKTAASPKP